jgi:hypothetical protein
MNFWCLSLYSQMTYIRVPQWALSNCWKTHKGVTNDASLWRHFCQFFFMESEWLLSNPCPLQQPWFTCQHIATEQLSQLTDTVPHIARFCLSLPLELSVGCISTMAYKQAWLNDLKSFQWHIVQTTLIYGKWICSRKSIFTAIGGLTDIPLVLLRHSVGVVVQ